MNMKTKNTRGMHKAIAIGVVATVAAQAGVPTVHAMKNEIEKVANKNELESLKIAVISDTHIFPEEYVGNEGPNYQDYVNGDRKMLKESERILEESIARVLESDAEIVLIPGDLTKDSEKLGHEILARQIKKLEDAGKEVFVTNGNHDINAPDAEKFVAVSGDVNDPNKQDRVEKIQGVMPNEFEDIYSEYGYDESQTIAQDPNSTSYAVQLKPGYRLISMDTGIYGENKEDQSTSGTLDRDGRLEWILNQVKEANEAGDVIIGMSHHGLVEHFTGQGTVFAPYLVERYEEVSTQLADAGMQFVFTGHFHAQDVAIKETANGNTMMDIMTGSSVSYPSPLRFVEIDGDTGKIHIESKRIQSIEDIPNFEEYGKNAMAAGVPGMVSSLVSDMLVGMIDGIFPESTTDEMMKVRDVVDEYMTNAIDKNRVKLESEAAKQPQEQSQDDRVEIIPGLLYKDQLVAYIEAVCEGLKTVEVETSIADNYKLMDAITHCLLEVYEGDEVYSEDMKTLKNELETTPMIADALSELLVKHKGNLGLVGMIINKEMIDGLLATEVSEGSTISTVIGGAFAGLLNGILTDDTPDNNAAYIGTRLVNYDLSAKINEAKEIKKGNYTQASFNALQVTIQEASGVIADIKATEAQINEAISKLQASIDNLEKEDNTDGDNTQEFIDVANDHWAKEHISNLASKGFINGYEDNTFRPDNKITRAEFLKIVNKVFGKTQPHSKTIDELKFTDVKEDAWYYEEVAIAVEEGYINGYEDNTFKPNQEITRQEAAKIVASLTDLEGNGEIEFEDADKISEWAKESVDELSDNKIIEGYEDNTFRPKDNITRAEAAAILDRIK